MSGRPALRLTAERCAWALAIAVAVFLVFRVQARRVEAADARAAQLTRALAARARTIDSLTRTLDRQVAVVEREVVQWRERWRETVRWDTLQVTDTVRVPVQVLVDADRTITACTDALGTCLVLRDALTASLADTRALLTIARRRPWTAAGVAYDPATGALGAFVDRDLWRFRVGASVGPDPVRGARGELRAGVRW